MSENLIISILGEIRGFVWDIDIPSSTCPEYMEHHQDCVEIMNFIDDKMDAFRGKSNAEVAKILEGLEENDLDGKRPTMEEYEEQEEER